MTPMASLTAPGPLEIVVILAIFILLFGAKKLPELGSSVGRSIKNFKRGLGEGEDAEADDTDEASTSAAGEQQP